MNEEERMEAEQEPAEQMDDDWGDIDLSDVQDSAEEAPPSGEEENAGEAGEPEQEDGQDSAGAAEADGQDGGQNTETKADETPFTLEYQGKEYNREEVSEFARRWLSEGQTAAQTAAENKMYADFVRQVAEESSLEPEAFMLNYRAARLANKESISFEEATKRIQMQDREKALDERERAIQEKESARQSEETERARRAKEFSDFIAARPDVTVDSIPKEVFQQVKAGTPLLAEYNAW